mmetsp:Transcript_3988/g.8174  ORF Transcript_3988/g.8174 Transcript_3988/m.8174 type:complete len:121 (+) Transcript_3988:104-466(+)
MRSIILVATAALASTSTAFVLNNGARTRMRTSPPLGAIAVTPELESAIDDVRACASEFGEETASFANKWIESKLAGTQDGTAAGILEECILDDDGGKCERFTAALEKLDEMLGVGAQEQY